MGLVGAFHEAIRVWGMDPMRSADGGVKTPSIARGAPRRQRRHESTGASCELLPLFPHRWITLCIAARAGRRKAATGQGFADRTPCESCGREGAKSPDFSSARSSQQPVDKWISPWRKPGGFEGRPTNRPDLARCRLRRHRMAPFPERLKKTKAVKLWVSRSVLPAFRTNCGSRH